MSKHLFTNHKAALAFAGITLVSVGFMIGPEDDEGMLVRTVETIEARGAGGGGQAVPGDAARRGDSLFGGSGAVNDRPGGPPRSAPPASGGDAAFADDSELVDQATGFDPTPALDLSDRPDGPIVEPEEVIILPRDVQQQLEL